MELLTYVCMYVHINPRTDPTSLVIHTVFFPQDDTIHNYTVQTLFQFLNNFFPANDIVYKHTWDWSEHYENPNNV